MVGRLARISLEYRKYYGKPKSTILDVITYEVNLEHSAQKILSSQKGPPYSAKMWQPQCGL